MLDVGGLNLTTTFTYDADGNQASVTDAAGSTTTSIYDGLDRLIETIDPQLSNGVRYTELYYYDGDNNQVGNINQRGIAFTTDYDNLNRIVAQNVKETISNDGQPLTLTATTYHDVGSGGEFKTYSATVTDANGNPTITTYDGLDRPLVVNEPAVLVTGPTGATSLVNPTIASTYDGVNLLSQTDANGNTTVYEYDADNRVIKTEEYDNTGALQATTVDVYNDAQQPGRSGRSTRSTTDAGIDTITQNDSSYQLISQAASNPSLSGEFGTSTVTLAQKPVRR